MGAHQGAAERPFAVGSSLPRPEVLDPHPQPDQGSLARWLGGDTHLPRDRPALAHDPSNSPAVLGGHRLDLLPPRQLDGDPPFAGQQLGERDRHRIGPALDPLSQVTNVWSSTARVSTGRNALPSGAAPEPACSRSPPAPSAISTPRW